MCHKLLFCIKICIVLQIEVLDPMCFFSVYQLIFAWSKDHEILLSVFHKKFNHFVSIYFFTLTNGETHVILLNFEKTNLF